MERKISKEETENIIKRKVFFIRLFSWGLIFMAIGAMMNFVAVKSNDCRMPVQIERLEKHWETSGHFTFYHQKDINHYYLTDIIHIGDWYVSIGDYFILIGALLIVIHVILSILLTGKALWRFL